MNVVACLREDMQVIICYLKNQPLTDEQNKKAKDVAFRMLARIGIAFLALKSMPLLVCSVKIITGVVSKIATVVGFYILIQDVFSMIQNSQNEAYRSSNDKEKSELLARDTILKDMWKKVLILRTIVNF